MDSHGGAAAHESGKEATRHRSFETEFTRTYILKILTETCYNPDFLPRHGTDAVAAHLFPDARMMDLARLASHHFQATGRGPTVDAMEQAVNSMLRADPSRNKDWEGYANLLQEMENLRDMELPDAGDRAVRLARWNAMLKAMERGMDLLEKEELEQIPLAIEQALRTCQNRADLGINPLKDFRYLDSHRRDHCIPTGYTKLDAMMGGGLAQQEVGIVLAGQKKGKSRFCVNIARHALQWGADVVYITLELTENEISNGFRARLTGHSESIHQPGIIRAEVERGVKDAAGKLSSQNLTVRGWLPQEASHTDIRRFMWTLADSGAIAPGQRPLMTVVDYARFIRDERKFDREDMAIRQRYLELFRLGRDFKAAVWSPAHTGRDGYDKARLRPQDISGCFDMLGDVSFCLALQATEKEYEKKRLRGVPIISRFGPMNETVHFEVAPAQWLIQECSPFPEEEEEDSSRKNGRHKSRNGRGAEEPRWGG